MTAASLKAFGLKESGFLKSQAFIDGKWVDANDGKTFKVTNPATGEELGTVPDLGRPETIKAIEAAHRAFKTWSQTTAKQRHDIIMNIHKLMFEHAEDLGRIITLEHGKPIAEAISEVKAGALFFEWFAEEAVRTYGETIPSPYPNSRNIVIKQPIGVVAAVTPWNFPSFTPARKIAPALAAGCTMVLKPSPETPYSAFAFVEIARRAGVPDGVLNIVPTLEHVQEVGAELCNNKTVKKVTFTGSTAVAKLLYTHAAGTMKKVSLEAGGNSPFIIFDDADLDQAISGVTANKYLGSGQACIAANRIYVQSGIYDKFASRLAEKVSTFKVGNGLEEGTTQGPLIHSGAVDKVERHVQDAIKRGASVLVGGKRPEGPGSFFLPTVLSDVSPKALLSTEETFGPLAALIRFETEAEVVRLANDSDYGLAGYLYSRDVGRVWRIAEALEVGMVGANSTLISAHYTPFGGIKESGIGREGSHGIDEFMNIKLIVMGGM